MTTTKPLSSSRLAVFTGLSMLAFTGNALICRAALHSGSIDAASFTGLRLFSGAFMLWLILRWRGGGLSARPTPAWSLLSGAVLFIYAAAFSLAYARVSAGAGALVLFVAVQSVMIGFGFYRGERFSPLQWGGLLLAYAGLVALMLPSGSLEGVRPGSAPVYLIMLLSGAAWGVYSLIGRRSGDPLRVSANNFLYSLPFALLFSLAMLMVEPLHLTRSGVAYAVLSGAGASALGYIVWYAALPALKATTAAAVQLSVPLLTALGGVILLAEPLTLRFALIALAIIGGLALVIFAKSLRISRLLRRG